MAITQVYMIPFNSRVKWMLTVHSFDAAALAAGGRGLSGGYLMYMKGEAKKRRMYIMFACFSMYIQGYSKDRHILASLLPSTPFACVYRSAH